MSILSGYIGCGKHGPPRDLRMDGRADDPAFDRPIIAVSIADRKVLEDRSKEILGDIDDEGAKSVAAEKDVDRNEVLKLVVDEGKTQEETAKKLGISMGTVNYHLKEAMKDCQIVKIGRGQYARVSEERPDDAVSLDELVVDSLLKSAEGVKEHSNCDKCIHGPVCRFKEQCKNAGEWALCKYWRKAG